MQSGPGSGVGRDVVVGPTRLVAARVFGTILDDAHVTTYDDFRIEVDPASVRSVGLVGDEQASGVLADLLAGPGAPPRILLGLPEDHAGRDELLEALTTHPALLPEDVIDVNGAVVVPLAPAGEVSDAAAARAIDDLRRLDLPGTELPEADVPSSTVAAPGLTRRLLARLHARRSSPTSS